MAGAEAAVAAVVSVAAVEAVVAAADVVDSYLFIATIIIWTAPVERSGDGALDQVKTLEI